MPPFEYVDAVGIDASEYEYIQERSLNTATSVTAGQKGKRKQNGGIVNSQLQEEGESQT
jgi:hypothetical protein